LNALEPYQVGSAPEEGTQKKLQPEIFKVVTFTFVASSSGAEPTW